MEEIVQYHNKLNMITFRDFLASDCDYFMFLCAKFKYKGEVTLTFSFSEIKEAVGDRKESNEKLKDSLIAMNTKLLNTTGLLREGKRTSQFVIFNEFETDEEEQTLTVTVNPKYAYLLNVFSEGFTRFDFKEFMLLNSKYSKSLYRLLKQFRFTGKYTVNIEDLKKSMHCPDNMETKYFMRDVVKKAIKELTEKNCFMNLEVVTNRGRKHGGPLSNLTFSFSPEKREKEKKPVETLDTTQKTTKPPQVKPDPKNKFNNFTQREYDYDELERKILLGQK